jgi:hypothetical protein
MLKTYIAIILACILLLLAAGCERIQEPWVRDQDQLERERSRSNRAQMDLRHRLLEVQTDR